MQGPLFTVKAPPPDGGGGGPPKSPEQAGVAKFAQHVVARLMISLPPPPMAAIVSGQAVTKAGKATAHAVEHMEGREQLDWPIEQHERMVASNMS